MTNEQDLCEAALQHGNVERAGKAALLFLLSFHPTCPRCPGVATAGSSLRQALWGHPVTHTDGRGPTCYEHAEMDAQPVEHWRALLMADVARSLDPGFELDEPGVDAVHHTLQRRTDGNSQVAVRAALRAYATRWGDDEDVASYSAETPERAERLGLCVYAVVAKDPQIRPSEVLDAFAMYRRLRWPRVGDPCPDVRCKGVIVAVVGGAVVCDVHKQESDRRAALTPDERKREDEASLAQMRAAIRAMVARRTGAAADETAPTEEEKV